MPVTAFDPIQKNNFFALTLSQTTKFRLFQTERLQTTILDLMTMAETSPKG